MEVVEALGATYSIDILGATGTPMSVSELSDSLEIPPATCYRRVDHLASAGLLEECDPESADSGRATLYRRTSDAVGIQFGRNPSVLNCDYVTYLSVVGGPAAGVSAAGGDPRGTVLALVNEGSSHTGEQVTAAATDRGEND